MLIVAGLFAAAGLCLFLPALVDVPDRISLISDGIQTRYVPALLVSTVVSLLVGAACFGVAYALYKGDRAAGPIALGYAAALVPALLLGYGRGGTEVIALLLLAAAAAALILLPANKPLLPWSPGGLGQGPGEPPRSVRAAWVLAALVSIVAGAIGLASVLAFSSATLAGGSGFLTGVFLLVFGLLGLGSLLPMKAGSINGRLTTTVAMGGVIVAILIDHLIQDVAVWTVVPLLLMALSAVVIGLLWLMTDSQGHFVRSDLPLLQLGSRSYAGPAASVRKPGPAAPRAAGRPTSVPTREDPPPPPRNSLPPPPPAQRPAPAESSWSAFEEGLDLLDSEFRAPPPPPPPQPTPPRVFHEAVGVAQDTPTARSAQLDLTYDQQSWFAVPEPGEQVHGALLVTMLMVDDDPGSGAGHVFQGSSTLLVTDRRLAGVCPKGSSAFGTLDARNGPVVLWSVPVGSLDQVGLGSSSSGPHLSIGQVGGPSSWLLLARPRLAEAGAFRPADMDELLDLVRRAVR